MLVATRCNLGLWRRMDRFADRAFVMRLERESAAMQREYAEAHGRLFPELGAAWCEIAGGIAAVLEAGSPANGAFAVGLDAEVSAEEFARLEAFFRDRGDQPGVSASPFSDPSLATRIAEAGWKATYYENVLARPLEPGDVFDLPAADVVVNLVRTSDERELWADLVAHGFSAPDEPTPAERRLSLAATAGPSRQLVYATVDGMPAGTGELRIAGGIGWLSADTTLPPFRRRGVQGALQRARLELAREAGCELAVTEAIPDSPSQRNMERLGFRIVYTRVEALAPENPEERTAR